MALTRESVDFREVVEFVIAAVTPLFKRKNLYLRHEIHDDIHYVFCDRTRIQEVLLNILSNAGRFTEQGGVVIRAIIEGENLIVSVTDTGPGIAKPDIDRLFKPFEQLDARIRRSSLMRGLGVNMVAAGSGWQSAKNSSKCTMGVFGSKARSHLEPPSSSRSLCCNIIQQERIICDCSALICTTNGAQG